MQVTVEIEDDVLRDAEDLARERGETLEHVLACLILKGVQADSEARFPTFPQRPGAKPVSSEMVKDLLEADDNVGMG